MAANPKEKIYAGPKEARSALGRGDDVVAHYRMTLAEVRQDRPASKAIGERALGSADLAQRSGFEVDLELQEWDNGDIYPRWTVTVPPEVDRDLAALVWDSPDGEMDYTLTRSTRHPGWQLTQWMTSGEPWGHRDIHESASEAFDVSVFASGVPLAGLVQVVFRDGRVLVREGARPIAFNPRSAARRKRNPASKKPPRAPVSEERLREIVELDRERGKAIAQAFGLQLHEGNEARRKLFHKHGLPRGLALEHWEYLGLDPYKHIFGSSPSIFGDMGKDIWIPVVEEKLVAFRKHRAANEAAQQLAPVLLLASVREYGPAFETGRSVTLEFVRNTEPSPDFGSLYQQDIEPHGRYMMVDPDPHADLPPWWERGIVTFQRPLVILFHPRETETTNVYDDDSWKARLVKAFGKTGADLSREIVRRGFDGIVTVGTSPGVARDTREIVDLTMWEPEQVKLRLLS